MPAARPARAGAPTPPASTRRGPPPPGRTPPRRPPRSRRPPAAPSPLRQLRPPSAHLHVRWVPLPVGGSGVISHAVERGGEEEAQSAAGGVVAPARPAGPRFFTGSFDHSVDPKHRLVLPAPFRPRLAEGAYLGPLDGFLGLWPEDGFDTVLT